MGDTDKSTDRFKAKFVIMSNGPLHRPKLPGIEASILSMVTLFTPVGGTMSIRAGIPMGAGRTARQESGNNWDRRHRCPVDTARWGSGQQLYVFQRTPSSIDVRANRKQIQNGLRASNQLAKRMDNFNILCSGGVVEEDLVKDGWTEIIRNLISMANYRERIQIGTKCFN